MQFCVPRVPTTLFVVGAINNPMVSQEEGVRAQGSAA